jgi:hypothetical protein
MSADEPELPPPPPSPGFVRVRHPGTGAVADIPEVALSYHRSRGWVPAGDDGTSGEPSSDLLEPIDEAPAPDPEEEP